MKQLKFKKPTFRNGMNITIRRGIKDYEKDKWNDLIHEWKIIGKIIIMDVHHKKFKELEGLDIEWEHDPECRTYEWLLKTMQTFYDDFKECEDITVVDFGVRLFDKSLMQKEAGLIR